jgi:hypothetical protein
MQKLLGSLGLLLLLNGCAHNNTTVLYEQKITTPKVIALDAPRSSWMIEIETRLRKAGFQVLRRSSQTTVTEKATETRTETYRESTARYVLVVRGDAITDSMHRCFGGGFNFNDLTAELVDTQKNETLLNVTGSGYSEDCPPMSGNLYGNIVAAVKNAWE